MYHAVPYAKYLQSKGNLIVIAMNDNSFVDLQQLSTDTFRWSDYFDNNSLDLLANNIIQKFHC